MSENTRERLLKEFPPVTSGQWEELIHQDLKGADYNKRLIWKTIEGIPLKPYYHRDDLDKLHHLDSLTGETSPALRKKTESNDWLVRQDIRVDDPAEANAKALDALMKGDGAVGFILDDNRSYSQKGIDILLKDICLASAQINFRVSGNCRDLPEMIDKVNISRGGTLSDLHGSVEYDPAGTLLSTGNFPSGRDEAYDIAAYMTAYASRIPNFTVLNIDASIFHNSGGSAIDDLAFAMASAADYLQILVKKGLSAEDVARKLRFTFAVGRNYFMEIAKIRAARYLWAKVCEAWGITPQTSGSIFIHTVTSGWNKTLYDPYNNMLRTTTEAMSAALGGADSLLVEPFDKAMRRSSTPISERVARNTQLILKEEAYFDKVADPAAGSYYIESLTGSLIDESWKLFLQTMELGGLSEAFEAGFIQDKIEQTAITRNKYLATRRDVLLGTNQYPNPDERLAESYDLSDTSTSVIDDHKRVARPLVAYRGAEPFESLRMKTEKHPGGPPKVFLLTTGNLTMRKARAGFSSGFFCCAGFEVIDNLGFIDVVEGAKAAVKNSSSIVVVCSSDEEYPEVVPAIAGSLPDSVLLVVAGYPKDSIELLKSAGVDYFIHARTNVLESLTQFQKDLGIG